MIADAVDGYGNLSKELLVVCRGGIVGRVVDGWMKVDVCGEW